LKQQSSTAVQINGGAHDFVPQIEVQGRPIKVSTQKYYFAVYKPKGFLCSSKASSENTPRLVTDLLESWVKDWQKDKPLGTLPPRLFTVGRLDVQSVGLIFVTNDGAWTKASFTIVFALTNFVWGCYCAMEVAYHLSSLVLSTRIIVNSRFMCSFCHLLTSRIGDPQATGHNRSCTHPRGLQKNMR
jgi:hypothetical protein